MGAICLSRFCAFDRPSRASGQIGPAQSPVSAIGSCGSPHHASSNQSLAGVPRVASGGPAEFSELLEVAMKSEKQKDILGRIREALKIPAPIAHVAHRQTASSLPQPRAWLPPVPPDQAGQLAMFERNCEQLRTEFCPARGIDEAGRVAKGLREKYGWSLAASHHQVELDAVVRALGIETLYMEDHPAQTELEKCSVGITACDALVAQTGSILLTARSAGGRALSVLPPHHLVVAQINQLVADLPAAFELLAARYDGNYPSFATFITGPSRTGDIERILVFGAHGPRMLTVILVQ